MIGFDHDNDLKSRSVLTLLNAFRLDLVNVNQSELSENKNSYTKLIRKNNFIEKVSTFSTTLLMCHFNKFFMTSVEILLRTNSLEGIKLMR